MKSKVQPPQFFKRLRSRLPRRRRSQISPIRYSRSKTCPVVLPIDLSASSRLTRDISCDSSGVSVNKPRPPLKKRGFEEISGFGENEVFRRVTRSYYRQRENEMKERIEEKKRGLYDGETEVSESSCVESCSGVDVRERSSILNKNSGKGAGNVNEFEGVEDPEAIAESEVSCVQKFSGEFSREILKSGGEKANGTENSHKIEENEVLLSDKMTKDGEISDSRDELLEVSRNSAKVNFAVSNSESTVNSKPKFNANDSDLACTEHLSYEDVSDYSSAFSDLQSELFQESSERDFSDYSPSIWLESGSEFSERSVGDKSPSPTFSQFLQYSQQFCRSTFPSDSKLSAHFEEDNRTDELTSLKLEDDEHENSYRMFRNRERRQVYLRDYAEEYCCTTDYGELVIQQRLEMVHWIVEQSTTKELQKETMFLGVSLMDRFLSKGFFKNKRNLQVVGIACLTLATRIVENQPLNSVRQKTFYVGSNIYNRYEVVAMEWLVQEVLNFQCFLPTIYSFLWFYLKAARANEEVEKTAKYLAVLVLLGHEQLCYWPSTVAAGLVVLSSLASNQDAYCHRVMETHLRTKEDDLPGCIKSLEWLVKYVC